MSRNRGRKELSDWNRNLKKNKECTGRWKDQGQHEKEQEQAWKQKVAHGYMQKKLEEMNEIDMKETNSWLQLRLTSHLEGYINAIQEQELNTKDQESKEKKIRKRESRWILQPSESAAKKANPFTTLFAIAQF